MQRGRAAAGRDRVLGAVEGGEVGFQGARSVPQMLLSMPLRTTAVSAAISSSPKVRPVASAIVGSGVGQAVAAVIASWSGRDATIGAWSVLTASPRDTLRSHSR